MRTVIPAYDREALRLLVWDHAVKDRLLCRLRGLPWDSTSDLLCEAEAALQRPLARKAARHLERLAERAGPPPTARVMPLLAAYANALREEYAPPVNDELFQAIRALYTSVFLLSVAAELAEPEARA